MSHKVKIIMSGNDTNIDMVNHGIHEWLHTNRIVGHISDIYTEENSISGGKAYVIILETKDSIHAYLPSFMQLSREGWGYCTAHAIFSNTDIWKSKIRHAMMGFRDRRDKREAGYIEQVLRGEGSESLTSLKQRLDEVGGKDLKQLSPMIREKYDMIVEAIKDPKGYADKMKGIKPKDKPKDKVAEKPKGQVLPKAKEPSKEEKERLDALEKENQKKSGVEPKKG